MRNFSTFTLCLLLLFLSAGCQKKDMSLRELDELVSVHRSIEKQYQNHIDSVRTHVQEEMTDVERFDLYGKLFDMYRRFDIDSQLVYAQKRIELAEHLQTAEYQHMSHMNQAEVLMRLGMYHESIQYLDAIPVTAMKSFLLPYYYHLRRTLYGLMADFATTTTEQQQYREWTQNYRDSLLRVQTDGSFLHELIRADALTADQQYEQALTILNDYETTHAISEDEVSIFAITKAQIYKALHNRQEEKRYLIISACSDLRGAVREYIALRELAIMLYQEGDIDHAYHYMQCALEDANAGGMRSRTLEISTLYPIIESAHQKQETAHKRLLYSLIGSIATIALLMWGFLIYVMRQRAKLAALNERLQITNTDLIQSNQIRTVYVGHYMEMTSLLIDRFDNWRRALNKYVDNGDTKHLYAEIASQRFTTEQLSAFYHDFDDAFLNIFPDFVEKVKTLMVEGTDFRTKQGERLNTDLRVLCCIRLGITDSMQIASFLRYSLSTIYNSRTRMRNAAKADRENFEKTIATL